MEHVGDFLATGKGLQYHDTLNEEEWLYYQKAMEAAASATSKEAARKIPVPEHASQMLDIGGAHGLYSVALCNKIPGLSSTILDLPPAVEKAKPILAKYKMGNRVKHLAANVLTEDLGNENYDFILMASVAHHFTNEENILVAKKAFKALKPGGVFTIIEVVKTGTIKYNGDMLSALGNFFFALSSTSGLWHVEEMKQWQKDAGFIFYRKNTFLTIPGYTAISGKKI
jgi:2-polyprenyl-3-methyl-5-hydroxy-6-metoxy-1,4-benzoquinol methylase